MLITLSLFLFFTLSQCGLLLGLRPERVQPLSSGCAVSHLFLLSSAVSLTHLRIESLTDTFSLDTPRPVLRPSAGVALNHFHVHFEPPCVTLNALTRRPLSAGCGRSPAHSTFPTPPFTLPAIQLQRRHRHSSSSALEHSHSLLWVLEHLPSASSSSSSPSSTSSAYVALNDQ